MILLGLDPGLRATGWGVISLDEGRLRHIANGTIRTQLKTTLAERLCEIFRGVVDVVERHAPDSAAIEETFVNKNPNSTLKLGQARGVAMLAPATMGIPVGEYAANLVKKTVMGVGHADKNQIQMMVSHLLPGVSIDSSDSADALAVAICHGHHLPAKNLSWQQAVAGAQ
ncbi:MAG: crossover junction endodeoxyribonuclease RuvC [Proteobacteria bacterium]|nr:crossover junction endodeoxyribonuclease RuvC [Pseudomonadota bacterium]